MNLKENHMKSTTFAIQFIRVACLSLILSCASWADISNTASVTYQDAANNSYSAASNLVTVTTPPKITSAGSDKADVGVNYSYPITATNNPSGFDATGLPGGLTIDKHTGVISGKPTTAGVYTITLSATNAAGTGTLPLVLTVNASASITLQKTSDTPTAKSGDTVTFTIQYQNAGTGTASSVVITDDIPVGTTLVPNSMTNGGTLNGNTITWNLGTVIGSGFGQVKFQVKVN
jgi:uncharacterized repeat protein (TIGR01451 family)